MLTEPVVLAVEWPVAHQGSLDDLLDAAGDGDRQAFSRLYDCLASRVFGLVLRVLVNRSLAEETTQDVFLEVWRKAASFDRTRGAAHTWVLTIAHHRAVDRVRTERTASAREFDAGVREIAPDRDVVADRIDDGERACTVRSALRTLSDVQRDVLMLAYFDGRSQSEIATLTQTPLGTVKTRTRDALIRLRGALTHSA